MSGQTGLAQLAQALGTAFDSAAAPWAKRGRQTLGGDGGWRGKLAGAQRMADARMATSEDGDTGADSSPPTGSTSFMPELGVFLNGTVSFSDREASLGLSGFEATTFGLSSGVDRRFGGKVVAGAGLGYTRDGTDFRDGGKSTSNAVYGVLYSTFVPLREAYIDAVLSVGWIGYDIDRAALPGLFANGKTNGAQLFGGVTGGYNFPLRATTLTPYFRLNGGSTWIGEYTETGAGAANRVWADNTIWSLSTVLAVRVDHAFSTPIGVVIPYVRGEYEHEFGDAPTSNVRPLTGLFGTPIAGSIDRNFFNFGAGVSTAFPRAWAGFVDYEGLFGADRLKRHTLTAGVRKEF
jgi:outer membrane autotransporter protein